MHNGFKVIYVEKLFYTNIINLNVLNQDVTRRTRALPEKNIFGGLFKSFYNKFMLKKLLLIIQNIVEVFHFLIYICINRGELYGGSGLTNEISTKTHHYVLIYISDGFNIIHYYYYYY